MRIIIELAVKFAEIGSIYLVTYICKKSNPDLTETNEWLIAASIFTMLMLLELSYRLYWQEEAFSKVDRKQEAQHILLEQVKGLITVQNMHSVKLISALAEECESQVLSLLSISYAGRDLSRDETRDAWGRMSWATHTTYCATNYIDPKDFYNSGYAKDILQLQKAKMRAQPEFKVKKVFIWENATERDASEAKTIIDLHQDDSRIKMDLRQVLHHEILGDKDLNHKLKSHLNDEIDFAIFDDKAVLVWTLENRTIKGGRVFVDEQTVKTFKDFFKMIVALESTKLIPQ